MNASRTKKFWLRSGLVLGVWTSIALIEAGSKYIRLHASGNSYTFPELLKPILLDYWIWAALTPLILWISHLLPFTRGRRLSSALAHCGACVLISVLHVTIIPILGIPQIVLHGFQGPMIVARFIVNFYSDIWMYWPIVGVWNLLNYYNKYRERETRAAQLETQLARAELDALRNQLQPHFLFNTLNSISALMEDDPETAEDMLSDLSSMLRATLEGNARLEISLSEELDVLSAYLRIQSRRFADRLLVQMDAKEDALNALVPSLILQPIVENAVRHGIAPLSRPGTVYVGALRAGEKLVLKVMDDGQGLSANYREGIGLTNTRERLRQHYGERQTLRLESTPGHGLTVRIEIPFQIAEESKEESHENTRDDRRRRTIGTSPASIVSFERFRN